MSKQEGKNLPADQVIDLLIQGNARFVNGLRSVETFLNFSRMKSLAEKGQFPFCILVTCSDSRIPIELIFDRGMGDLFVVRTFGNIIDPMVIASIEYAVLNFGIEAVIVMGHSRSGAVRTTMESENSSITLKTPYLQETVDQVRSSLIKVRKKLNYFGKIERHTTDGKISEMWEKIFQSTCDENIRNSVKKIKENSLTLTEKVHNNSLYIVPAKYDVDDGKVIFELPSGLLSKINPKVIEIEAFKSGKTVMDILEKTLVKSKEFNNG